MAAAVASLLAAASCAPEKARSSVPTAARDTSRMVVLNGDITEVVFALGLGAKVVATDISATYPAEAATRARIGYQRALNAEGILAQRPTLVLGTADAGPPTVIEHVRAAGVPVVILPVEHDLGAAARKIMSVAKVVGVPDRGRTLATSVQRDLDGIAAEGRAMTNRPRLAVLYVRGANTHLVFGRGTGADTIADTVGATPAVDVAGIVPLTPEALITAAPDVLVVPTSGLASVGGVDGLLGIPGVAQTPAGRARRVLDYDDQMLLGFGPRLPSALRQLLREIHPPQS